MEDDDDGDRRRNPQLVVVGDSAPAPLIPSSREIRREKVRVGFGRSFSDDDRKKKKRGSSGGGGTMFLSLLFSSFSFLAMSSSLSLRCELPSRWIGSWYHDGFPAPLNVTADSEISGKGTCVHEMGGGRFIIRER